MARSRRCLLRTAEVPAPTAMRPTARLALRATQKKGDANLLEPVVGGGGADDV